MAPKRRAPTGGLVDPVELKKAKHAKVLERLNELLHADEELASTVLHMVEHNRLTVKDSVDEVNGELRIASSQNKYGMLNKAMCVSLMSEFGSSVVFQHLPVSGLRVLLCFCLCVELSCALYSKHLPTLRSWVKTRYQAVGARLQHVVWKTIPGMFDSGPASKEPDWSQGCFSIVDEDGKKLIKHIQGALVMLPDDFDALRIACNNSESKAVFQGALSDVLVKKIFAKGGVEVPVPLNESRVQHQTGATAAMHASVADVAAVSTSSGTSGLVVSVLAKAESFCAVEAPLPPPGEGSPVAPPPPPGVGTIMPLAAPLVDDACSGLEGE